MERNRILTSRMDEVGFTQAELADELNSRLQAMGHQGTVSDRTVRNWLTGKSRWPHPRQRAALEAVFGCTAAELGFVPPTESRIPTTQREEPVRRRSFLSATSGTTAALVPLVAARPNSVGISDVIRLRDGLDTLMALDNHRGGHETLENAALAGARQALDMQARSATQRVRQRLFSVAAGYTATAAWSALDARLLDRAQQQLDRALYLAGMAQDATEGLRVWNSYAMLAHQRREHTKAVDAAQAAQATAVTRRDPLFASLAHARTAIGHANCANRQAALRSLGYAHDALATASPDLSRPSWVAFYGPSELSAITAIVHDSLGDASEAEAASHKALGGIPQQFLRNRALATTRLALAQLHQRDIDQACVTAKGVFDIMAGTPIPGRMRSLLGDFYRDLITLAPTTGVAREWGDLFRAEWSRA